MLQTDFQMIFSQLPEVFQNDAIHYIEYLQTKANNGKNLLNQQNNLF